MSLPIIEFSALALWLGAAVLFSAVVAPAAFAVLPTRTLAGDIVGRVLPVVFYAGMLVGAIVVAADAIDAEEWRWSTTLVSGALIAIACASAQLVVGSRIDRVRSRISGPVDALAPGDPLRVEFGRLHGISVALLGVAMLAAVVALIAVARDVAKR
ncbi:MAG TPA: DUF4149 domain-containing protein [Gemmatimonadaceae bacterium]|jgi:uncharacterized protein DUF4149|nr:DUF4149 domain-containing protein [Gemmatimonadaceae bacterium]